MVVTEARFSCDSRQWQRFIDLCAGRDESPGAVLRNLIRLEIQRCARREARSDNVIDEPLLGSLRLLVAAALIEASDWSSLQAALAKRGLRYRAKGGGLVVTDLGSGTELAKGSLVGPGYMRLMRRFGSGFPGHPQVHLATRVLSHS